MQSEQPKICGDPCVPLPTGLPLSTPHHRKVLLSLTNVSASSSTVPATGPQKSGPSPRIPTTTGTPKPFVPSELDRLEMKSKRFRHVNNQSPTVLRLTSAASPTRRSGRAETVTRRARRGAGRATCAGGARLARPRRRAERGGVSY